RRCRCGWPTTSRCPWNSKPLTRRAAVSSASLDILYILSGVTLMTLTVVATYENGLLKPEQPLPLKEHEKVRVTVESVKEPAASPPEEAERIVRRSYGLIGWTGDAETLRRVAEDPEFGLLESP